MKSIAKKHTTTHTSDTFPFFFFFLSKFLTETPHCVLGSSMFGMLYHQRFVFQQCRQDILGPRASSRGHHIHTPCSYVHCWCLEHRQSKIIQHHINLTITTTGMNTHQCSNTPLSVLSIREYFCQSVALRDAKVARTCCQR